MSCQFSTGTFYTGSMRTRCPLQGEVYKLVKLEPQQSCDCTQTLDEAQYTSDLETIQVQTSITFWLHKIKIVHSSIS